MADIPASAITGATLNSIQNTVKANQVDTMQAIGLLPISFIKSIQRGRTTLGTAVNRLDIPIQEVDPNKTQVNLISYRNDEFDAFQGEAWLTDATTLTFSNQASGSKVNSMRYSWEVIEFV